MKLLRDVGLWGMVAMVLAGTNGCGGDENGPTGPSAAGNVVVTGEVTAIQNEIAVDGGIILDVDLTGGGSDRLIFGSLFTVPPPSEAQLALYDVVRRVEVGDVVRGEGRRRGDGVVLEKLWILDGRP